MNTKLEVGLVIIGDEILSGKRNDQHFNNARKILSERGIAIAWSAIIGDEKHLCERFFNFSFTLKQEVVFSFGGIGSTPDDNTRQACADALGLNLELTPEAEQLIREKFKEMNTPITPERLKMGEFPSGSRLIPNPVNDIPGFFIKNHYFFPGFPKMACPMMEWVLDTKYQMHFSSFTEIDHFFLVNLIYESSITPALTKIANDYPNLKIYSLPQSSDDKSSKRKFTLELGVKIQGTSKKIDNPEGSHFNDAIDKLRNEIILLGGLIVKEGKEKR